MPGNVLSVCIYAVHLSYAIACFISCRGTHQTGGGVNCARVSKLLGEGPKVDGAKVLLFVVPVAAGTGTTEAEFATWGKKERRTRGEARPWIISCRSVGRCRRTSRSETNAKLKFNNRFSHFHFCASEMVFVARSAVCWLVMVVTLGPSQTVLFNSNLGLTTVALPFRLYEEKTNCSNEFCDVTTNRFLSGEPDKVYSNRNLPWLSFLLYTVDVLEITVLW